MARQVRRRVPRKSRPMRKRRVYRRNILTTKRTIADYATCSSSTTITPIGGGNFVSNQMYSSFVNGGIKLSDFPRAVAIAKNYQHFKIKQVKLTLKWGFDTFQNAVPLGGSRPSLYYMIDKSSSLSQNTTLENLKAMGAKPHACDNRQFVITWRPSVLTEDQSLAAGPVPSQYRISPWLATNPGGNQIPAFIPSTVAHNGIYWYIEQLFNGGVQYNAELEVQFAFKKPLFQVNQSAPAHVGFQLAEQDNSSDGIVGGPDSNNVIPNT